MYLREPHLHEDDDVGDGSGDDEEGVDNTERSAAMKASNACLMREAAKFTAPCTESPLWDMRTAMRLCLLPSDWSRLYETISYTTPLFK